MNFEKIKLSLNVFSKYFFAVEVEQKRVGGWVVDALNFYFYFSKIHECFCLWLFIWISKSKYFQILLGKYGERT